MHDHTSESTHGGDAYTEGERVRVERCLYDRPAHIGRVGRVAIERTSVDDGQVMVVLDGPLERTFDSPGLLCVATRVIRVDNEGAQQQ